MADTGFRELEHTADLSIRARGRDLNELFVNAALGMFELIADLEAVTPGVERRVELEGFDPETLLVSWLGELLWLSEESDAVFVRFEIGSLTPTHLVATAWGGPAPELKGHIKAVTFHNLKIAEIKQGYQVTLVFDV